MADSNKHTPSLRFPEFLNDGEWETATMESIFEIKNGYTPSKSNPDYWEGGTIPWFRMEDIRKSGHILSDSIQHITPSAVKSAGLFPAYSIIVATTATIGEHALIIVDSLANQRFTFLTKRKSFDNRIDMVYFHYFMFIIDEWCKQNTNAGGLLSVNMDAFKKLVIPYPASLSEQRKIAECFSSIDKQIAATKRKLEQLKEHKRGLMQLLFPARGKTVPELRFPEFLNDGEWEMATMESIFEIKNGYTPSKSNPDYWEGGTIPWFRMEDIRKSGHILSDSIQHITPSAVKSAGLFPAYSIIVATTATIGEHALIIVDSLANQRFTFLTKRKSFDNRIDMVYFHYFMFIIDEWCKQNTNAGGLLSVNMEAFRKLVIPYPASLSEQHKIAECFSSIDKQIAATKRKFEQLKEHQKGLMQRLFPIVK